MANRQHRSPGTKQLGLASPLHPPWMSTSLASSVWKFIRYPDLSTLSFSFSEPLGKGFKLSDPSHAMWRESMHIALVQYGAKRGYGAQDGQHMYYQARRFLTFFRWLVDCGQDIRTVSADTAERYAKFCAANGGLEFHDQHAHLETDNSEIYSGRIDKRSQRYVLGLLSPIILLWQARTLLPFSIKEDPFPNGANVLAKRYGNPRSLTPIIPLNAGAHLLQGAIHWIEDLGPLVLLASEATNKAEKVKAIQRLERRANELGFPILIGRRGHSMDTEGDKLAISFSSIVESIIPHSFFVATSSLTLARPGEISTLVVNCISGNKENGFWASRYIEKNYKQTRATPVHPTIVAGVELLANLFRARREALATNYLLPRRPSVEATHIKAFNSTFLNLLARITKTPITTSQGSKAKDWNFTPRQFRGFGAALWAYRFELPVVGLSVTMFHFDFVRTSTYLANKDFIAWAGEYSRRLSAEVVEAAASGSTEFAGKQSKRFARMTLRLRQNMIVVNDNAERRVVRLVMEDASMVATPNAWGFCFCGNGENHLRRATCLVQNVGCMNPADGRPDSEASSAGVCCGCRYFATNIARLPYLRGELSRTESFIKSPRIPADQKALAEGRRENLMQVITDLEESSGTPHEN